MIEFDEIILVKTHYWNKYNQFKKVDAYNFICFKHF